jgi:phage terminase large subunit-like protein
MMVLNNNPAMNWMLSNVALQEDAAGNIKPAKNKSKEKIDGIVALVMALGEMMHTEDDNSVYENRDILIL